MYCRNCGYEVESINTPCTKCGFLPLNGKDYCQECGYTTMEGQVICTNCQQRLKFAPSPTSQYANFEQKSSQPTSNYQSSNVTTKTQDVPNVGANIAACCTTLITCFPIVGIILYFVWKEEKPNAAKSVCLWSLIPFIFVAIFYLVFIILGGFASIFGY